MAIQPVNGVSVHPETSSGLGLPDSGGGVPRSHECPGGGIEGKERFTRTGAGIIGRNSGALA